MNIKTFEKVPLLHKLYARKDPVMCESTLAKSEICTLSYEDAPSHP